MKTVIATVLMTLGVCLATSRAQADTLYDNTGGSIFSGAIFDGTILFGNDFLLDNGSFANGSGRTVSGPNIAGGWTVFQPFEVTGPGWNVTTIGVDGWRVLDPLGLGMLGTLLPDSDGDPDEGNPIASNTFFLATDPYNSNWRDEAFDVTLTPGIYWMKWEDNGDPGHHSAIFNAPQGLDSFSRRDNGNEFSSGPTALRIAGEEIPAPGVLGLFAIGLGKARRRRRTVYASYAINCATKDCRGIERPWQSCFYFGIRHPPSLLIGPVGVVHIPTCGTTRSAALSSSK